MMGGDSSAAWVILVDNLLMIACDSSAAWVMLVNIYVDDGL